MPTFVHGRNTSILVNQYDVSTWLNNVDMPGTRDKADTSTFGSTAKSYVAGLKDGMLSLSGYWDGTALAVDAIFTSIIASADQVISVGVAGNTTGNRAVLANAQEVKYDIKAPIGGAVAVSSEFQCDGGIDMNGVWLQALTARSASGDTHLSSVDNAASSTTGWAANLHVTAASGTGGPTCAVKVQNSSDNSTFVDLSGAAFTTVSGTGLTSQQITGTGTVLRYLDIVYTLGGSSPNYTFAVAFARR